MDYSAFYQVPKREIKRRRVLDIQEKDHERLTYEDKDVMDAFKLVKQLNKKFEDILERKSTYSRPQPKLGFYIEIYWPSETRWVPGHVVEQTEKEILVLHGSDQFLYYSTPLEFDFRIVNRKAKKIRPFSAHRLEGKMIYSYTVIPAHKKVECHISEVPRLHYSAYDLDEEEEELIAREAEFD